MSIKTPAAPAQHPRDPPAHLAIVGNAGPPARLDAGGARLRLRALHVMGHGSARIARAVGAHPHTIRALVRGKATTISPQLRNAIVVVYDAWWDKRAPIRTRFERAAATAARRRAIAGNWCTAAALDDELLDIPGYRPGRGWKPATGTGVALDINPPALQQKRNSRMTDDNRFTWALILEILEALERHGYRPNDDQHTGEAIGLIRDVARTYEGTLDASPVGYIVMPSPHRPGRPGHGALIISADEVRTLLAALDDAAEYKRDRIDACADCDDQSCTTCQWRLQTANAYDQLADHLIQAAAIAVTQHRAPDQPAPGTDRPPESPGSEAGK